MAKKKSTALRGELYVQLREQRRRLEMCRVCAEVAVNALRYQNADNDANVVAVLMRHVADPLGEEVWLIKQRMAALEGKPRRKEKAAWR